MLGTFWFIWIIIAVHFELWEKVKILIIKNINMEINTADNISTEYSNTNNQ